MLKQKQNPQFLRSRQQTMRGWMDLLENGAAQQASLSNRSFSCGGVSEELEDNSINFVDSGTNVVWTALYHSIVILVPHGILIL
jgi:hypothetical protein